VAAAGTAATAELAVPGRRALRAVPAVPAAPVAPGAPKVETAATEVPVAPAVPVGLVVLVVPVDPVVAAAGVLAGPASVCSPESPFPDRDTAYRFAPAVQSAQAVSLDLVAQLAPPMVSLEPQEPS